MYIMPTPRFHIGFTTSWSSISIIIILKFELINCNIHSYKLCMNNFIPYRIIGGGKYALSEIFTLIALRYDGYNGGCNVFDSNSTYI